MGGLSKFLPCFIYAVSVSANEASLRPQGFGLKAGFVGGIADAAGAAASAFPVPNIGSVPGVSNLPGYSLAEPFFELMQEQKDLLCEFPEYVDILKDFDTPRYYGKMKFTQCQSEVSMVNAQQDVKPYAVQGGMKVEVCPGWKAWRTLHVSPCDGKSSEFVYCAGEKGCRGKKFGKGRSLQEKDPKKCHGTNCHVGPPGYASSSDEWDVKATGETKFAIELCPDYTLTYGKGLLFHTPEVCLDQVTTRQYDISCSWTKFSMTKRRHRGGRGSSGGRRLSSGSDRRENDVCRGCPYEGREKCNPLCKQAQDAICEGVREKFKYMDEDKFADLEEVCTSKPSVW